MDKIIEFFKKYDLKRVVIFTIAIIIVRYAALHLMGISGGYLPYSAEKQQIIFSLTCICIAACVYYAIVHLNKVHYTLKTGRNLRSDKKEFGLSYKELLKFYSAPPEKKLPLQDFPRCNWRSADGVVMGSVDGKVICHHPLSANGDGRNFLLLARPGDGKTSCVAIPSARVFDGNVFAIDIKGDIYNNVYQYRDGIKVFDPDDPENSFRFNPLHGIEDLPMLLRIQRIQRISFALIEEEKDGKYFTDGARDYFCGISLYLLKENTAVSLGEIARAIVLGNVFSWTEKIMESDCIEAQEFTNSYYGSSEKNVSGVWNQLVKSVRMFATEGFSELFEDGSGREIKPGDLEYSDVYIRVNQENIYLYRGIITLITQTFMEYFKTRPDSSGGKQKAPILFILDEFVQLNFGGDAGFEMLQSAIATLRSRGVSLLFIAQSLSQIEDKFGRSGVKTFVENAHYIMLMSVQDPDNADYFSRLIGTQKGLRKSFNTGSDSIDLSAGSGNNSRGVQEIEERIIKPEELASLGNKILIYHDGKHIIADKTPYYK